MNSYDIDVIIPAFNAEKYIAEALQSIQQQTLPVSNIIIADDGSTDKTSEIIDKFKESDDRILHLKLIHKGVSAARNAGIEASSATYIAFMDADDIWLSEKLEKQIDVFEKADSETGFVHSSYFVIDEEGNNVQNAYVTPPQKKGDIFLLLLFESYVLSGSASSVIIRRDILDKVGYFDERLYYGEDWDLWLRLAKTSNVDFTPEAVVGIRVHNQSAQRRIQSERAIRFFQQHLIVYSKWPDLIAGKKHFMVNLRKQAIQILLPFLKKEPRITLTFYKKLASSNNPLECSLFKNIMHFYFEIGIALLRIIYFRIRCKVGLETQ